MTSNINQFKVSQALTRTKTGSMYEQQEAYEMKRQLVTFVADYLVNTKSIVKEDCFQITTKLEVLVMTVDDFYSLMQQEIQKREQFKLRKLH